MVFVCLNCFAFQRNKVDLDTVMHSLAKGTAWKYQVIFELY